MKVLVGSKNPVKIEATREAFGRYFDEFEISGIEVESSVPDQPLNHQTYQGALNRASRLKQINEASEIGARFFVGIEGGIEEMDGKWFSFGAMCIMDVLGKTGYGTSIHFELPPGIIRELKQGEELGNVIDSVSGGKNTKRKGGAISFLTQGVIDRKSIYVQGLIAAIIPFINEKMYKRNQDRRA